ncbi:GntR family transcriptional regulator [Streptomyces sp. JV180]|uniref:GntR family transcriptional regulator n=1 Tax=Streptomyces sp. JV180 TaxID=858634 RepID=UPI00168AFC2C|nr:GntR family transcriptional regulator [Streptomyces sp. JV180]MBD3549842.1 GntR family transcriptional regulator [Streptomyces sp. JV180]
MPEPPERTALYRLYDSDDVLLYIGISNNPEARWERHKMFRPWWPEVASKDVKWFPSRVAASTAEEDAIQVEAPRFNGTHNYPLAPFDAATWPQLPGRGGRAEKLAELIRLEITSDRWPPGSRIPNCRALGEATGTGKTVATHAIRILRREGRLTLLHGFGLFVTDPENRLRPHGQRNQAT